MMTSFNGNIFRVTGPLCGEFTGPGEVPAQWPVARSFDVFFDLRLNKRLSKQPWGWWFETPTWPLWRQYYGRSSLWWALSMSLVRPQWTKSDESIFILLWLNTINDKYTTSDKINARNCPRIVPVRAWLHLHSLPLSHKVRWPDCCSLITRVVSTVMPQQGLTFQQYTS